MNERIAIIGGGNMGAAFFAGLQSVFPAEALSICDRNADKLAAIGTARSAADPMALLPDADIVLLAVKPQGAVTLLNAICPALQRKCIISIMAGISLKSLRELTGSRQIVRAMPNLGVRVLRGVTGWIGTEELTPENRTLAKRIFASVGTELELGDEAMIDSVTALSGSGPAYYFRLCEIWEQRALDEGFAPAQAKLIAEETFLGTAELMAQGKLSAAEWRAAVTSKGGTTEAAFRSLEKDKLEEIFGRAIEAGKRRSTELNA